MLSGKIRETFQEPALGHVAAMWRAVEKKCSEGQKWDVKRKLEGPSHLLGRRTSALVRIEAEKTKFEDTMSTSKNRFE